MELLTSCTEVYNYTLWPDLAADFLYTEFDSVAITVLMPLILSFGIVGNCGFLLVLYRVPKMRSLTNFYLANLAVSDSVFLLVGIGSKIHEYRVGGVNVAPVYGGVASCLLKYLVVDLSYFASLFMVTLVSLEKYYVICKPLRHRLVSGWDRTIKLTAGSWAVSVVFAASIIPSYCAVEQLCIVWPKEDERYNHLHYHFSLCYPLVGWSVPYANTLQSVPFFIASIWNTFLYVLIIRRLTQRASQPLARQNGHFPDNALRARDQVAKMLVINGTIFFLLLAPFEVLSVVQAFHPLDYVLRTQAEQVCRVLSYFNSAINPFVFGMVNPKYRRAFKQTFFPGRGHRVHPGGTVDQPTEEQHIRNPTANLDGRNDQGTETNGQII